MRDKTASSPLRICNQSQMNKLQFLAQSVVEGLHCPWNRCNLACLSGASTPIENEPVMDCCLVLTTLSGKAINSHSVLKFDRFLEDQVMAILPL